MSWRGRLSRSICELRFVFHAQSASSLGVRSFLNKHYFHLKRYNPTLPILVRDGPNEQPTVLWARYGWNEERRVELDNKSIDEVLASVKQLYELGLNLDDSPEFFPEDNDIIDERDVRLGLDV
eukprot:TRINITY_DN14414_c0_g1_i1.p1 TRINITY_DN14414_c0_g1~~TRINITY_DN14414_c0_g1_i1.p1  ORF type:complete len:123 (+),score=16.10 TRINITY_DN14414_c0_g1_i1:83-451(+)